ncbi:unnamed protein product [Rotaria sordida]|uniref:Uncharacterized protein n=1 Tax=Rotaria sordida TaxID=392033 RepID=A0A814K7V4_9BILA|nr:unnamed protein product [Rotaria sordida]
MSIYVFILLLIYYPVSWCQYDFADVTRDTRIAVNDDMLVSVSNAFINFAVILHPFRNDTAGGPITCNMKYSTNDFFVRSVAVAGITKNSTDSEQFMFVFTAEKMSTMTPYVYSVIIMKSTCIGNYLCTNLGREGSHQEYFLIGVDTNGTYAYGFTSSFVFKLDIYANKIISNLTTNDIWPSQSFIPHALDVADTWAVVAGYGYEYLLVQRTDSPGITGECNINIIMNHYDNINQIILAQYCSKFSDGLTELLIGVMINSNAHRLNVIDIDTEKKLKRIKFRFSCSFEPKFNRQKTCYLHLILYLIQYVRIIKSFVTDID